MERPLSPVEAFETIQRLLKSDPDPISFPRHARQRAAARRFDRRDVQHVLRTGTVGGKPEWDSRFENWKYRVTGTDLDGQELTLIVALDLAWSRITVVTGF